MTERGVLRNTVGCSEAAVWRCIPVVSDTQLSVYSALFQFHMSGGTNSEPIICCIFSFTWTHTSVA